MKPTEFKESNVVLGEGQPQYQNLPAYMAPKTDPSGTVITRWNIESPDEMKDILLRGCIWFSQQTFHKPFQPMLPSARTFFIDEEGIPNDPLPPRNVLALAQVKKCEHYSTVADLPDPEAMAKQIMELAKTRPDVAQMVGYISRMVRQLESQ